MGVGGAFSSSLKPYLARCASTSSADSPCLRSVAWCFTTSSTLRAHAGYVIASWMCYNALQHFSAEAQRRGSVPQACWHQLESTGPAQPRCVSPPGGWPTCRPSTPGSAFCWHYHSPSTDCAW